MKKSQKVLSVVFVLSLILSCFSCTPVLGDTNPVLTLISRTSTTATFSCDQTGDSGTLLIGDSITGDDHICSDMTYEPDITVTVTLDPTLDYNFYVMVRHFSYYDYDTQQPVFDDTFSNVITIFGTPDYGPLTISVDAVTSNSVSLSWSYPNTPNPDAYYVVYDTTTWSYMETIYSQSCTITNLQPHTTYSFSIDAYHGDNYLETYGVRVGTGPYNVFGYVNVPVAVGSTVTLNGTSVATDATGRFDFTGIANGTYNLQIAAKSALTRTIPITVAGADLEVSLSSNKIPLMFGDADHSAKIDNSDLSLILGAFNATPSDPRYNINYDFESNGIIDNNDKMTIQGWFNKVPSNYPLWVK